MLFSVELQIKADSIGVPEKLRPLSNLIGSRPSQIIHVEVPKWAIREAKDIEKDTEMSEAELLEKELAK